ncbi:cytochrome oxidase complex assembly protein 1-domain-containing protein [Stachybotrys elegans]|uniref:Cytochrome oxidase complex assembly protein 1-domain-containing protein n=1 Tax=Stachybotrys elegans TaxID=80388 RepID=A0A8K0SRX1_9HYPO|nr:cytochrome oxidase complex assembly protein 1-domain-containing protein [Stachybotrys elegans]
MLSRVLLRRRLPAQLKGRGFQRRWISPAPRPGDGPLMSRRADRELPDIKQLKYSLRTTLPIFFVVVAACSVAILNYQTASSPVVSATLFALRTSPKARAVLGDEIYFKSLMPWIGGEINQLAGRINVHFSVRGTRGTGVMRFSSSRPTSKGLWETSEWSLRSDDGQVVDLLEGAADPFMGLLNDEASLPQLEEDLATRGFRQQGGYNR